MVPNTISKVEDKTRVKEFEEICKSELIPQQVGVGVKFAAELLAMGLRMTLRDHVTFALINIDIKNAYNVIIMAATCAAHLRHEKLRRVVPYRRAKVGPHSPVWACSEEF